MDNFTLYTQHDSMQCGIACLAMICKHYGKEFSIETLSRYCFASTEGVSLLGISEAANKLGLHSVCGRVSMEQMQQAPLPCILHWNQNHFVVLYKQKQGKKFYIADPGKGLITYNRKEFVEHWVSTRSQGKEKGIAMFIQPTPVFYEQEGNNKKKSGRSNSSSVICVNTADTSDRFCWERSWAVCCNWYSLSSHRPLWMWVLCRKT